MKTTGWATLLCLVASGAIDTVANAAGDAGESRLRLVESRVSASTAEGRFTLTEASAKVAHAPANVVERFRLVDVRQPVADCNPYPDPLFANGFE